jgi:hypothetical protein
MESKTVVKNISVNRETGHIVYHVHTVNTEGNATWNGPVKDYGVDLQMLRDRFNGNIEEFEAWILKEHAPYVGANPELTDRLLKRIGGTLG